VQLQVDPVIGSALAAIAAALGWGIRQLVALLRAINENLTRLEERTRWMVRERRPTPLDEPAPEPADPELTPVDGLRAARARVRTNPRGVPTEYSHRPPRRGG
jgi:hypothetical protein